jgi:hypothetical protein
MTFVVVRKLISRDAQGPLKLELGMGRISSRSSEYSSQVWSEFIEGADRRSDAITAMASATTDDDRGFGEHTVIFEDGFFTRSSPGNLLSKEDIVFRTSESSACGVEKTRISPTLFAL